MEKDERDYQISNAAQARMRSYETTFIAGPASSNIVLETSRHRDGSVSRIAQQHGVGYGVNDLGHRGGTTMTMNTSPLRNKL